MDLPFGGTNASDDFETGTAAAFGGTTTIIDFAVQGMGEPLQKAYEVWQAEAKSQSTTALASACPRQLGDMDEMVKEGVTSFKLFMAYPGVFQVDDATIFRALKRTGDNGGFICMHAENGGVIDELVKRALLDGKTAPKYHALTRPAEAEGEATGRAIALSEMAGVPIYIVHLSAAHAPEGQRGAQQGPARVRRNLPAVPLPLLRQLRGARLRRRQVRHVAAAAPQVAPGRIVEGPRGRRPAGGLDRPLPVLHEGGFPGDADPEGARKDDFSKIPNGAPGVETRLMLLYDGGVRQNRISLHRFVQLVSTAPAKLFGLFPRKGTVAVGSDADLVLFDPNASTTLSYKTLHMRVDYNPYEGRVVTGLPKTVISRGEVVVEGGKFTGRPGRGFLKRGTRALAPCACCRASRS
jgi:dihydropyrimidinase